MFEFVKIDTEVLYSKIKELEGERYVLRTRLAELEGGFRKRGLIATIALDIEAAHKGLLKVTDGENTFFIEKVTAKRVYVRRNDVYARAEFFSLDTEAGQQLKHIWDTEKK